MSTDLSEIQAGWLGLILYLYSVLYVLYWWLCIVFFSWTTLSCSFCSHFRHLYLIAVSSLTVSSGASLLLPWLPSALSSSAWSESAAAAAAAFSRPIQVVYTVLYSYNYLILCGVWLCAEIQLLITVIPFHSASRLWHVALHGCAPAPMEKGPLITGRTGPPNCHVSFAFLDSQSERMGDKNMSTGIIYQIKAPREKRNARGAELMMEKKTFI